MKLNKRHNVVITILIISSALAACGKTSESNSIVTAKNESEQTHISTQAMISSTTSYSETTTTVTSTTTTITTRIEPQTFQKVDCSSFFNAALSSDGKLYGWGENLYGQFGFEGEAKYTTPVYLMDNIIDIIVKDEFCAAINKDGKLYTWGKNYNGVLGNGTNEDCFSPCKILENVEKVTFSGSYGAAITKTGELYMWGSNGCGQFGNGTNKGSNSPIKIKENVQDVQIGNGVTVVLDNNGDVYTSGCNDRGYLGNGTKDDSNILSKVLNNVSSINTLNGSVNSAITKDGKLYMWGSNANGHLCSRSWLADKYSPFHVMDEISSVHFGAKFALAISKSGNLYSWGEEVFGIDDGHVHYEPSFVMGNVKKVFSSNSMTPTGYVITNENSLYAWGSNGGMYGCEYKRNWHTPQKSMSNIEALVAKGSHVLAITTDGYIKTFGSNNIYYNNARSSYEPIDIIIYSEPNAVPIARIAALNDNEVTESVDELKKQAIMIYDMNRVDAVSGYTIGSWEYDLENFFVGDDGVTKYYRILNVKSKEDILALIHKTFSSRYDDYERGTIRDESKFNNSCTVNTCFERYFKEINGMVYVSIEECKYVFDEPDVEYVRTDGDEVWFKFTHTYDGDKKIQTDFSMIKEDGEWKIGAATYPKEINLF